MYIHPVNKTALTELIADQLQSQIIDGTTKPGDKLPSESVLCQKFQVSRSVLRESLAALISKGVLERRNNGIFVKEVSFDNLFDTVNLMVSTNNIPSVHILEARMALEIETASLAAVRATEEDLIEMESCISSMENPLASEAEVRYYATEFHSAIAKASHNTLLESFYKIIIEILRKDDRALGVLKESASQHIKIYECIRRRDEEGVRREMHSHLNAVNNVSIKRIQEDI